MFGNVFIADLVRGVRNKWSVYVIGKGSGGDLALHNDSTYRNAAN